jgi:hypothetical protein
MFRLSFMRTCCTNDIMLEFWNYGDGLIFCDFVRICSNHFFSWTGASYMEVFNAFRVQKSIESSADGSNSIVAA